MNLYELASKYKELLDYMQSVDVTTEEQEEVFHSTLESVDGAIEEKAENIVHVLHQLRADEETIDKEIKRLRDKKRSLENNQRSLKEYLKDTMEYAGKDKIKTPLFSIWTQNNRPSVVVEDEDKIPQEFMRERTTITVDKRKLAEALQEKDIDGVRLEQSRGVRFR